MQGKGIASTLCGAEVIVWDIPIAIVEHKADVSCGSIDKGDTHIATSNAENKADVSHGRIDKGDTHIATSNAKHRHIAAALIYILESLLQHCTITSAAL
ncbi:hypothetical protein FRX31_022917 [Thalictrum thalictroides]|uniref:Uncharacterized protein n=1 Tax=Thalictrum thalictroides TaxID=46969 RepID=A0A7J6VQZ2_THATH|nr:hypothetical protein FRX31_022917 [Thalictrum thalictroides]